MNMNLNIKKLRIIAIFSLFTFLMGCSASHTAMNKRSLDVQTKMSATIFLEPVAEHKKRVFVQVRNTTDQKAFDLGDSIKTAMIDKGYRVVRDPDNAYYILQANVLRIAKTDLRAAQHALNGGYGAALTGAAIGAGAGALASDNSDGMIIGALVGGAISTITDAFVKDISFTAVTDIQVSERIKGDSFVRESTTSTLVQGTSGTKEIKSNEKTKWKRYQTRIVSTANKVNLKFEKAKDSLVDGLTRSIVGIF